MKRTLKNFATIIFATLLVVSFTSCKPEDIKPTGTNTGSGTGNGNTDTDKDTTVIIKDTTGTGTGSGTGVTNTAPVTVSDEETTDRATTKTINVLSNDSDKENDVLSITGISGLTSDKGTVTISNNTLKFTPNIEFVGTVTFEYTVSDGKLSSTGSITVNVTKTAKEIATENLLNEYSFTRMSNVDGMSIWSNKKYLTFDTKNKTISVNFVGDDQINFMMSDEETTTYKISPDGKLVLPNITYTIKTISGLGTAVGLHFTADASMISINKEWKVFKDQ